MDQPAMQAPTPKPLVTRERLIEIVIFLVVSYIGTRFGLSTPVPVPQVGPQSAPAPVVIVLSGSSTTPTLTPAGK